jgi:hypothetical protein
MHPRQECAVTVLVGSAAFKLELDRAGSETSEGAGENDLKLKMGERHDWALFRTIDGLQQKAGVAARRLRRLVLKELADNALDAGSHVRAGALDVDRLIIEDDGPGLDGEPEEIASLFSIGRPLRSTKLLRLPRRGALGNGLRVVAGAVLASEGSLAVITRNRRIVLRPQSDGSTAVVEVTAADWQAGTRIEIGFGPALPFDGEPLEWARAAAAMARDGSIYEGKTSPHWYDPVQFHELLLAYGSSPLRSLVAQFDGCSGGKAGEIVSAAGLDRATCESVDRQQAKALLKIARGAARKVNAERLGFVGREAFPDHKYAIERGYAPMGSESPQADIPFVVEAWAQKTREKGDIEISVGVNRTPVTGEITAYRTAGKDLVLRGCGLSHCFKDTPRKGEFDIRVNILTPYCPITSDGKAPNLEPFAYKIGAALMSATKKAQRAAPKEKRLSQKDVVLENLDQAIADASGDGEYRFNERQLFYQLRPIVLEETGQELKINNFKAIITDYENENGEIEGMYREPRGSIYHPHIGETISLGTLTVEDYERPIWNYNKLVYIEKEGFSEALKDNGWPERHDCAVASSKGYTTRAVRDLVDKIAEHDEPCTIYCVHDADAYGTMIYQTFQEETRARGARKVQIVNLGLEPWEAVEAGLEIEDVEESEKRKPVAEYVLAREDGDHWEEWLQTHRVELNAMTTPQFIEWLDDKMTEHEADKLIPPPRVIRAELDERLEAKVRAILTERILREAGFETQVGNTLKAIERPNGDELANGIGDLFVDSPECQWRDHVETVVDDLTSLLDDDGEVGGPLSKH